MSTNEQKRKGAHHKLVIWRKREHRHEAVAKKAETKAKRAGKHAGFWHKRWSRLRPNPDPHTDPSNPNKVIGGSPRERLVFAARKSEQRSSFYSQTGTWDIRHGITGPSRDKRSDCSSWVTAMYWSAGLPDPNGQNYTGGYTGTLVSHCREISRSDLKPGDLVIYGPGPGHHVEMYVGDGRKSYAELAREGNYCRDATIGHGSPPIDAGTIDMLAGARFFRSPDLS